MNARLIIDSTQFNIISKRLCYELIEHYPNINDIILIGMQPRGGILLKKILATLQEIDPSYSAIKHGLLDITFYRDDFKTNQDLLKANSTHIDFSIEHKNIVLIDDVLFTGRSVRSAMDALTSFGRPANTKLLVFIDRRFRREVPVQADFIGQSMDTLVNEKVRVTWQQDQLMGEIYIQNFD